MRTITRASLLVLLALATPALSVRADDSKPEAAGDRPADEGVVIYSLRAADPVEVAAIIRDSFGCTANGSTSMGAVLVTRGRMDEAALGRISEKLQEFDNLALTRLEDRQRREQVAAAEQRKRAAVEQEERRELAEKRLISIDFAGGTIAEYLELIRKTSGLDNIVTGSEGINTLRMPAVRVKRVTGAAAVMLLQNIRLTSSRGYVMVGVDRVEGDADDMGVQPEPVLVVNRLDSEMGDTAPTVTTEVFDLQEYKRDEPEKLAALIDAVRTAVELQGPTEHFKLALHEGTGLVFVRGTEEEIEIAMRTVRTFTGVHGDGNH